MMAKVGALLILSLFGILNFLSISEAIDCYKPPDITSVKDCCANPSMSFDAFKSQCGKYMPIGSPRISPCLYECIFNATNVLDGTNINLPNARIMIQKMLGNNQGFIDVYADGLQNCTSYVDELLKYSRRRPPAMPGMEVCSHLPLMYVFCAQKYVFAHCPSASWTSTNVCDQAKEYAINCQGKQSRGGPPQRYG